MASKEYKLAIKIAGEIEKSFYESTRLTKKELNELARQAARASLATSSEHKMSMERFQNAIHDAEPGFRQLEDVARKSFKGISIAAAATGTAIGTGLGLSVSAGSEFETAFAGVKKTVEGTDAEMLQMRNTLRGMAKEMPQTAAELSEIAESAGQLAIDPQNIPEFVRTMANIEVSTNLDRESAAQDFARFANITEMGQDRFDKLGSTVVALGNTTATTEADIVSMGMRIAAAGDQIGLTPADIMGYAAALSSVGIEAEAGGSSFSKMLVNLQLATETGKNLKEYAKVAGMTGKEFKEAFQKDASDAINAFLSGLKDTERNGKSAIAVLTEMGVTEVRLRDTLLRSSNASEMFETALTTANRAWEENMALTNEATQFYETFENQCAITKNNVTDLGISLYDAMRPGLTEGMGLVNEFISGLSVYEAVAGDIAKDVAKSMPTMARQAKNAGKAFREFADPFLDVGGWMVDNPGVIVGTIAGVGGALATYKVASGIASLATSLSSLATPMGWISMGAGAVVAGIAGIGTAVKKSADDAKKANLDKHFGNISLSMKELQETAAFIINDGSLEQMHQAIAEFNKLDGISDEINDAAQELSRMDWKVSIGMQLSEGENESYQQQIEAFVNSTQSWIEQQHYSVTLSVTSLLGDDLESNNIVTQLNQFYAGKEAELREMGADLNKVVTDAFQDGLLDIDEVREITELKQQIAHMQSAMAESDFQANLDLIEQKYGGDLDADSFQNVLAEVKEQSDKAMEGYNAEYLSSVSAIRMEFSEGEISQEEFDRQKEILDAARLQHQAETQAQGVQWASDYIRGRYGEEVEALYGRTEDILGQRLNEIAGAPDTTYLANLNVDILDGVDPSTVAAVKSLYSQLQPEIEQLQEIEKEYLDDGKAVPEAVRKGLTDAQAIAALGGDGEAMWSVIGETAQSDEYRNAIKQITESGNYIPAALSNVFITDGAEEVRQAVYYLYDVISQSAEEASKHPVDIPIELKTSYRYTGVPEKWYPNYKDLEIGHKDGGIFDVPHVAWFAEDGPEAAIPIDDSQNARELWLQTGELLGMKGLSGEVEELESSIANINYDNSQVQISYNPTIQIHGSSVSKEDVEDVMETEQEKFARMMEEYLHENRRVGFS